MTCKNRDPTKQGRLEPGCETLGPWAPIKLAHIVDLYSCIAYLKTYRKNGMLLVMTIGLKYVYGKWHFTSLYIYIYYVYVHIYIYIMYMCVYDVVYIYIL